MCEQLWASSFSEDMLEIGLTEDYDDASFLISQDKEERWHLGDSSSSWNGQLVELFSSLPPCGPVRHVQTCSGKTGGPLATTKASGETVSPIFSKLLAELSKIWSNCPYWHLLHSHCLPGTVVWGIHCEANKKEKQKSLYAFISSMPQIICPPFETRCVQFELHALIWTGHRASRGAISFLSSGVLSARTIHSKWDNWVPIRIGGLTLMLPSGLQEVACHSEDTSLML